MIKNILLFLKQTIFRIASTRKALLLFGISVIAMTSLFASHSVRRVGAFESHGTEPGNRLQKEPSSTTAALPASPGRPVFLVGGIANAMIMTNTDGSNAVNLTDAGAAQLEHPSVSRQTGMIAFGAQNINLNPPYTGGREIFVMNADGSGVRQVTFLPAGADGRCTQDFNPETSPDGTKVAFISSRTAGQQHQCSNSSGTVVTNNEVWVVNVDGTGLGQVTTPKYLDDSFFGCTSSNNYAVAWSADSQHIAVLGDRVYAFQKTANQGRKGMFPAISIDNADLAIAYGLGQLDRKDEEPIKKARIPAGAGFIDWAPDGTILFESSLQGNSSNAENAVSPGFLRAGSGPPGRGSDGGGPNDGGGGGGGFADCIPEQTLVGQIGFNGSTDGNPHGGQIFGNSGSVRYSPDGSGLLIAGTSPLANNNNVATVFVGNGNNPIAPSQGSGHLFKGIAWAPGATIPTPAKLVLSPDPIVLYDQKTIRITPTVLDAQGNVIVHAANWHDGDAGFRCDNTPDQITCTLAQLRAQDIDFNGKLTPENFESVGNLCARNGDLRTCAPYFVANSKPVITVFATKPNAAMDNSAPGVFTISRSGSPSTLNLSSPLIIPIKFTGTAVQGVDFQTIGQTVTIPAGQASTTITLTPLFNQTNRNDKFATIMFDGGDTSGYYSGFPADQATIQIKGSTNPAPAFSVTGVTPNIGGDGGGMNLSIFGQAFSSNATAKLVLTGQPDIAIGINQISESGTSINGIVNLIGRTDGVYDVVVTNGDGTTARLPASFTIQQNQRPQMWVSILGRSKTRSEFETTYEIVYGNRGNTDAYMVPLIITGIPQAASATVALHFDLTEAPPQSGDPDMSQIPVILSSSKGQVIPLIIGRIPAGQTSYLKIGITILGGRTDADYTLQAVTMPPLYEVANPSKITISDNVSGP